MTLTPDLMKQSLVKVASWIRRKYCIHWSLPIGQDHAVDIQAESVRFLALMHLFEFAPNLVEHTILDVHFPKGSRELNLLLTANRYKCSMSQHTSARFQSNENDDRKPDTVYTAVFFVQQVYR